ncbi:trypsin delta-like [Drosophila bipectinata]|uniref:trypsin delta-like n=1 Tax=Drosophila bipectinata TaxID=42026 RepID=UPI001C8A27F4|nr:trypsin delta-like [Drosophila bipectinata]
MFTQVLVLLSFASFLAATPGAQRIIGGEDISIEKVPRQVSLQLGGKHICGGSIYNESYIITAAHCVEYPAEYYMVRAGSSKHNSGGVLVQVAGIKYHENFIRWSTENDVAVIRLEAPLPIGDNIKPIRLAEEDPFEGSPALNTG